MNKILKRGLISSAAVFLTHSDVDHIAACSLFENAVIYLSKAEEQKCFLCSNSRWVNMNMPGYLVLQRLPSKNLLYDPCMFYTFIKRNRLPTGIK
jgi:hypothetical protein